MNEAKFKVVHEIEDKLPVAMYQQEWKLLEKMPRYRPLNAVERIVPWVFIAIYVATFGVFLVAMYLPI